MSILRALEGGSASLQDLQELTGIPRATAHRLLLSLEAHGMVRRDPIGRFCLGFELLALGRAAAESFPMAEIARPALAQLRDRTGESVQLFVREGDARRCVVSLQSPHGLRWIVPEGALLPLRAGSAGTALLGGAGARGWVESIEEREAGVASVSAAVRSRSGDTVAAISVSGPVERLSRSPGALFGAHLVATVEALEADLRAAHL